MPWQLQNARRFGDIGNDGTGRIVVTLSHTETGNAEQVTARKTTTGAGTATSFRNAARAAAQARLDELRAADSEADITGQITLT